MRPLIFSPSARKDLDDIFDHIAADNPTAAGRFVGKIKKACSRIADFPNMGFSRDDLAPGVRCVPVGTYIIFYRPRAELVEIVRVLHGSRDCLGLVD